MFKTNVEIIIGSLNRLVIRVGQRLDVFFGERKWWKVEGRNAVEVPFQLLNSTSKAVPFTPSASSCPQNDARKSTRLKTYDHDDQQAGCTSKFKYTPSS